MVLREVAWMKLLTCCMMYVYILNLLNVQTRLKEGKDQRTMAITAAKVHAQPGRS